MKRSVFFLIGAAALAIAAGLVWLRASPASRPPIGAHRESPPYHVHSAATLDDVQQQTGVPVDHLIRELHLPENVATDVPLRRLSTELGFRMREVRRVVREYLEQRSTPTR